MKILKQLSLGIFFVATCTANNVFAQARKKAEKATLQWRYETECVAVGLEGTKLIKVWSYSTKPKLAIAQAKKNAIHALIFKGFSGNGATGCPVQQPLVDTNKLSAHTIDFFSAFFSNGGPFMKYVSTAGEGEDVFEPGNRIKIGREYKIGITVTVMYEELRKYLENEGIIKQLTNGF